MRERHDPQATARANHGVGGCESAIDHRGKAATVVHDLNETEGAANIDHAPERILAIGLPKLDLEARRPQRIGDLVQGAQIGIHAEIEILGKPHIAVCCQGDGPDHQRSHASRLENAGDLLGSPNHLIGVGHWSRLAGAGWSAANRRPNPKAALTLSSTVMRRTRMISACSDALWLTLGRSRGKDGSSNGWFAILS